MTISKVLAIQDGVITMKQARDCGLSEDAVLRKVRSGEWIRHAKGVYQSAGHRRTHVTRFRVAMFSLGTDAVAHGPSAAWWHGLTDTAPAKHSITVPQKRTTGRPGVSVRRRNLRPEDIATVRGVRTTDIPLTVLEVGDSVLMDQALQKHISMNDLEAAYARNRNCTGSRRAKELLDVARTGGRSEAERLTHRILKPIAGWRPQLTVNGKYLDIGFEELRIGLEIDGWRWHKDSHRNGKDMQRQNSIVLAGWTILRYDWHRLANDADGVLEEVQAAVGLRASLVG
ncbi:type IV toxin-antitoxin system AbiEi family antitoxin domain-containing protein [Smaragdicoccus niigatensis]|uniref:type IV toxin-antitoxin system AbiEi family antitoxin domain-containing protein n=1 Tax=Smaragdicoccus niigatensis TaxID=359359 RepID=UPI0003A8DFD5|nr:type IV toxin-antitoxin system AbiEi family antitoxin domain-containing protein [Smaragdicoccus niigatensis]